MKLENIEVESVENFYSTDINNINKERHIVIIGGGISGLMCAYSFIERMKGYTGPNHNYHITILEKGDRIENRNCPLIKKKVDKCAHCNSCSIMEGMAGAGAFSDGKYLITTEYGGWLPDIIGKAETIYHINRVDDILTKFGGSAVGKTYYPYDSLKTLCLQNDLHMLQAKCKHLGTDKNYETMRKLIGDIESNERVEIITNAEVTDVTKISGKNVVFYKEKENNNIFQVANKTIRCDIVVFAVGRSGSSFLTNWCKKNRVPMTNNQVDIGVRVELPYQIWYAMEEKIYEPKIVYRTKKYNDIVRMFCFNGRGEVVTENTDGILTVNGHAYESKNKKTELTNFALLSTINFTEPFNQPIEYAKYVAGLCNMIAGGGVLVQRLGDLEAGRRTDAKRLKESTTTPSLTSAVAGDLSLCLPKRQLDNIIETLHALDKVAPGTANYDTLLYGIECKYYSARPKVDENFKLQGYYDIDNGRLSNIYAIGDGAGFTRSLAQAGAHGDLLGTYLNNKFKGQEGTR